MLRGLGVTMALPWMESLRARGDEPGGSKKSDEAPTRMAILFTGCGFHKNEWWAKGQGKSMELGKVCFAASPRKTFEGVTPIISEGDTEERWEMLLMQVHLSEGCDEIPHATASYADIGWVTVSEFLKMADDSESPMGGLCIESTAKWLREVL